MFDLDAPIVPGESAAGIRLGDPISSILEKVNPRQTILIHSDKCYEFGPVSLWEENGEVTQIGLYAGYRGALAEAIRVGSTIQAVQEKLGQFVEDEDDNLVVESIPGWCFETENWLESRKVVPDPALKITEIYVFSLST
jgi:hypothetical protein